MSIYSVVANFAFIVAVHQDTFHIKLLQLHFTISHIPPSSHPSIHSYRSITPNTGFILIDPRTICMYVCMNILIPISLPLPLPLPLCSCLPTIYAQQEKSRIEPNFPSPLLLRT
ncbi:hypothetical protein EYC80_003892 [Monilinia laxa]|uniref:Uncharacterized protein n=1 Tax=Monilinia laxa TaxID=61186 RepID=A0A5N6KL50_MONLA|nr:hypothetical protein EYC80_003892 [Monilinia laxa]